MFVELNPGTNERAGGQGGLDDPGQEHAAGHQPRRGLLVRSTPTRATTCELLINGAGEGLHKAAATTCRRSSAASSRRTATSRASPSTSRVRHRNLRRLIHQLNVLNTELAGKGDELAELVDDVVGGVPRVRLRGPEHQRARSATCPARCSRRRRRSARSRRYADVLGPAVTSAAPDGQRPRRRPTRRSRRSPRRRRRSCATRSARSSATRGRSCATSSRRRRTSPTATPDLTRTFTVLNHLFNMVGFNPNGKRGPGRRQAATRASCSGSPGSTTTAPRCSRARTPTARSAR